MRGGGALRAAVFRRAGFDKAAEAIGVAGLHPHELRHTAASLAIASGANVKLAQLMLGHKSATVTLDQYGHLFGDDLDTIADRLDACAQEALGARPHRRHATAEVVSLPTPDSQPARCPRKCGLLCTGDHSADFNTEPNWPARAPFRGLPADSCGLFAD